jgi:hypothetical protein
MRMEYGRFIALGPVHMDGVSAPKGAVILVDTLIDTKVTYTTANGDVAQVDVSENSLRTVRETFEEVIGLYRWRGHRVGGRSELTQGTLIIDPKPSLGQPPRRTHARPGGPCRCRLAHARRGAPTLHPRHTRARLGGIAPTTRGWA